MKGKRLMDIGKIMVVGAGFMGSGIAQLCAQAKYNVILIDVDSTILERSLENIRWSIKKLTEKGKISEKEEFILSRIKTGKKIIEDNEINFIIEAVYENLNLKKQIFNELGNKYGPNVILATNTSAIPITEIATAVKRPERVIGVHFFSPVLFRPLVEVVKGLSTSEETIKITRQFITGLGKETILVHKDIAGFVVNRINGMATLEAMRLLEQGVAAAEEIDKAMRLGLGHQMGPFETMDFIGLDVVLNARMAIYNETKNPIHFPPDILRRLVSAGHLGRKTGKGFYEYKEQ